MFQSRTGSFCHLDFSSIPRRGLFHGVSIPDGILLSFRLLPSGYSTGSQKSKPFPRASEKEVLFGRKKQDIVGQFALNPLLTFSESLCVKSSSLRLAETSATKGR